MKKQLKSLTATFALATAAILGAGAAQPAHAQDAPPPDYNAAQTGSTLNPQSVDYVASFGPRVWYQYVGEGFRDMRLPQTREWIGLEFNPNGYVPYDLNNPVERDAYRRAEIDANTTQREIQRQVSLDRAFDPYFYPFYGRERLGIEFGIGRGWGLFGERFGHAGGRFQHEGIYEGRPLLRPIEIRPVEIGPIEIRPGFPDNRGAFNRRAPEAPRVAPPRVEPPRSPPPHQGGREGQQPNHH